MVTREDLYAAWGYVHAYKPCGCLRGSVCDCADHWEEIEEDSMCQVLINGEWLDITLETYQNNGRLAIVLTDQDGFPYDVASVNLEVPDFLLEALAETNGVDVRRAVFCRDDGHYSVVTEALEAQGFLRRERTNHRSQSGWIEVPLFFWTKELE